MRAGFGGIDLNSVTTLFSVFVAENKLRPIMIEKIDASKVHHNQRPIDKRMLSLRIDGPGSIGADLVELSEDYSVEGKKIIKEQLSSEKDLDLIYHYELAEMIGDPKKIENRLSRFFDNGVNWDDSKSFIFKDIRLPSSVKAGDV